jgi:hypothetical protein
MHNQPALLDRCWTWLTMALVGEELDLDDDICGAVVSIKPKMERIQLWIRERGDGTGGIEKVNGIGKRMMRVLDLSESDGVTMEFQVRTGMQKVSTVAILKFGPRMSRSTTKGACHSSTGSFPSAMAHGTRRLRHPLPWNVPRPPFSPILDCQLVR